VAEVADGLRRGGKLLQQRRPASPVLVAQLEHPLVLEAGKQFPFGEHQGLLELSCCAQSFGLAHVDPDVVREPDPLPGRHERAVSYLTKLSPERPERAPQACSGALVEHLRPEARGHRSTRVQARVQREPHEQGARPIERRRRPVLGADLDAKASDRVDAQQRRQAYCRHEGLTIAVTVA
jgi:hypothetical protein